METHCHLLLRKLWKKRVVGRQIHLGIFVIVIVDSVLFKVLEFLDAFEYEDQFLLKAFDVVDSDLTDS